MKIRTAGAAEACSQLGPPASVMTHTKKHVAPSAAEITPRLCRRQLRTSRGDAVAAIRARRWRIAQTTLAHIAAMMMRVRIVGVVLTPRTPAAQRSAVNRAPAREARRVSSSGAAWRSGRTAGYAAVSPRTLVNASIIALSSENSSSPISSLVSTPSLTAAATTSFGSAPT
jgi:hypothetical protein